MPTSWAALLRALLRALLHGRSGEDHAAHKSGSSKPFVQTCVRRREREVTNITSDVFVKDLTTGATQRVLLDVYESIGQREVLADGQVARLRVPLGFHSRRDPYWLHERDREVAANISTRSKRGADKSAPLITPAPSPSR